MPGGDHAIVDLKKLTQYCLSTEHARGKHKAQALMRSEYVAIGILGSRRAAGWDWRPG